MSGVESTGNVRIYQGDDYSSAAPLTWTDDGSWPSSLTSAATVTVVLAGVATYTATFVEGTTATITLELTDTQTMAIGPWRGTFQVLATEAGATTTLQEGTWTSAARVTA